MGRWLPPDRGPGEHRGPADSGRVALQVRHTGPSLPHAPRRAHRHGRQGFVTFVILPADELAGVSAAQGDAGRIVQHPCEIGTVPM